LLVDPLEGVPAHPYIVWEDRITDILARYELRSPIQVLLGYFSSVPTSPTPVRVVTIDVGCGLCPIPYPRICTPCAQSRVPRSDMSLSSSKSSTARFRVLLKASSSSPELRLEGVFRVLPWLHRGSEVLMPQLVVKSSFIWGAMNLYSICSSP
jgi:hypothetical protein